MLGAQVYLEQLLDYAADHAIGLLILLAVSFVMIEVYVLRRDLMIYRKVEKQNALDILGRNQNLETRMNYLEKAFIIETGGVLPVTDVPSFDQEALVVMDDENLPDDSPVKLKSSRIDFSTVLGSRLPEE